MKQYVKTFVFTSLTASAMLAFASDASAEYCREYTQNIMVGGRIQEGYSTACLKPDGSWQTVSGQPYIDYSSYNAPVSSYGYTTYNAQPMPVYERRSTVVTTAPVFPMLSINIGRRPAHPNWMDADIRPRYRGDEYCDDDHRGRGHGKHRGRGHGNRGGHDYYSYSRYDDFDDRHGKRPQGWGERRIIVDRMSD